MKIKKPEVVYVNGGISYRTVLEGFKGKQTLWYTLDQAYADFVSDQSDAALLALLIPAMEKGEDIFVEGLLGNRYS